MVERYRYGGMDGWSSAESVWATLDGCDVLYQGYVFERAGLDGLGTLVRRGCPVHATGERSLEDSVLAHADVAAALERLHEVDADEWVVHDVEQGRMVAFGYTVGAGQAQVTIESSKNRYTYDTEYFLAPLAVGEHVLLGRTFPGGAEQLGPILAYGLGEARTLRDAALWLARQLKIVATTATRLGSKPG
jgi:hypothetical protein